MSVENDLLVLARPPTKPEERFDAIAQFIAVEIVLLAGPSIIASNQTARRLLAPDVAHMSWDTLVFRHEPTQRSFRSQFANDEPCSAGTRNYPWFAICDVEGRYPIARSPRVPYAGGDQVPPMSLVALYGLTPKQATIAAHVLQHSSVASISQALNLSRHTVKTHLKRIFTKCAVHSLTELAILVATGPH